MGHSKSFMLDAMHKYAGAIMTLLNEEDVKIKEGHLGIPEDATILRADFIRPAYHWLLGVHDLEYNDVLDIKRLLKPEIWKRYKDWGGFDDHREMVLLQARLSELRRKLVSRERPDFFKKTLIAKGLKRAQKKDTA
jgi:hypothetical protein